MCCFILFVCFCHNRPYGCLGGLRKNKRFFYFHLPFLGIGITLVLTLGNNFREGYSSVLFCFQVLFSSVFSLSVFSFPFLPPCLLFLSLSPSFVRRSTYKSKMKKSVYGFGMVLNWNINLLIIKVLRISSVPLCPPHFPQYLRRIFCFVCERELSRVTILSLFFRFLLHPDQPVVSLVHYSFRRESFWVSFVSILIRPLRLSQTDDYQSDTYPSFES